MLLEQGILFLSWGPCPTWGDTWAHELMTPIIAGSGCAWSVKVWWRTFAVQTLQRIDPV